MCRGSSTASTPRWVEVSRHGGNESRVHHGPGIHSCWPRPEPDTERGTAPRSLSPSAPPLMAEVFPLETGALPLRMPDARPYAGTPNQVCSSTSRDRRIGCPGTSARDCPGFRLGGLPTPIASPYGRPLLGIHRACGIPLLQPSPPERRSQGRGIGRVGDTEKSNSMSVGAVSQGRGAAASRGADHHRWVRGPPTGS
jgi:hypothetical protein